MKANLWNKENLEFNIDCQQIARFSQYKRISKTKKIQYIAICQDRIQLFTDPDYKLLHGEIAFSFGLTVEWIYIANSKIDKKIEKKLAGFKLSRCEVSQSFYLSENSLLQTIQAVLNKSLLQRNIHHHYKLIRKLGKGGFGSVYLLLNKKEHKFYAAKVFLKQQNLAKENKLSIEKEIKTLKELDHSSLIKLKEAFISDNSIYLITDYCSGPSLEQFILQNEMVLTKNEICDLMKQILNGLAYLHSKGIMHRDIKPQNILFRTTECKELVLIDFGLAEAISSQEYLFPRAGTPGYVAPEIANNTCKSSNYTELCDIFSLGCVMYLLVTGESLFDGQNSSEIFEANKKCIIELDNEKYQQMDPEIKQLLQIMLEKDPSQRKRASEIISMNIFTQLENQTYFENDSFDYQISETSSQNSNDILTKLEMLSEMPGTKFGVDYIKEDNFEDGESTQLSNSSKQLLMPSMFVRRTSNKQQNNYQHMSLFKKMQIQENLH